MNRRLARIFSHLLLLTGTAIFLFPFVWMFTTSIKTDEELGEAGWWPTAPTFRAVSPYARPDVEVRKPADVDGQSWQTQLPFLRGVTLRAVEAAAQKQAAAPASPTDRDAYHAAATAVLLNRLTPRLNRSLWTSDTSALVTAYQNLLTPDPISAALDDRLASLELRGLQIRTLDARVFNIATGQALARDCKIVSGEGTISSGFDAAIVSYRFPDAHAAPLVITFTFDFPASSPQDLHKLILSLRPDDSWHRLDATLDVGGTRFVSRRTSYLAQHRPQSFIFQPPTHDDATFQPKTWVPLGNKDEGGRMKDESYSSSFILHPSSLPATLTLTITPTSSAGAAWAKGTRNYVRAFYWVPFWRYVANSVLLVALTTIGTLFSSTFVAYAFARLHWPGRTFAFVLLLATMMLPAQVTMVPSFVIWRSLGWYNTLNPLWAPAFLGGAFFIFLMTQHMKTIPRELEESARIDGLNAVQTWYYIIVPQVKPAAAAVAIMTFMWSWNDFLGPLIYLRDQGKFPLSLGLFGLRLENFGDWSLIMAANVLMTLPVIVIFFLFQRYFIQGMTMSGLK